MSGGQLDAFVPCETFEVTVWYGPEEVLSPLEIEVIHAINSGVNTLPMLVDLYGLGSRPMFDLVSGLWKADYIYVNFHDSTLLVKESVEKLIRERNFEALNRTEIRERSILLMQELVTGAVLPLLPHASTRNTYRIVPQLVPFGSYREIPKSRIADLVARQSMRLGDEARSLKVHSVNFQPRVQPGGGLSVSRRLLQLRLHYGLRHARPVVEIASPITIDGQVRRQLEEAVGQLAQERQDDPFSRHLLDLVNKGDASINGAGVPKSLETLLADLERRIEGLQELKAEEYQVRHQALEKAADSALNSLQQRRARRARVRLLVRPQETVLAIEAALRSTKSQIVLCSPHATWAGAARYWGLIEQAVAGGATLFLLWGDSRQSTLDKVLERNLIALSERNECTDRVHWCQNGLGTNESFLVTDCRLATLATFSLLGDPRSVPASGLAVEFHASTGSWCEAVAAILERVRRNALDHAQAKVLGHHWVTQQAEDSDNDPVIPGEPGRPDCAPVNGTGVSLYVEAWQTFARELHSAVAALGTCVEMIFDGAHRQVLMQALEARPSNLVLASGLISPEAITPECVTHINACVKNGTQVSITYHADRHRDGRSSGRLNELDTRSNGLHVRQLALSGGVVATDTFAAISGFNFLGAPGFILQEHGQRRLEAGIVVYGVEFARQVAEALDHPTVIQDGAIGQVLAADTAAASMDSHELRDLQALTACWQAATYAGSGASAGDAGLAMERVFRQVSALALEKGRWKLFDAWVERLPDVLATRSVANLLAQAPLSDLREIRSWRLWLARKLWFQRRFVETAVLLADLKSESCPSHMPTFGLAKAAGAGGAAGYRADRANLLIEAMDDDVDADRTVAWICIASIDLLVHGVPDAAIILADLAARAPAPWAVWCRSLVRFWEQVGQAIPFERFEARRQGLDRLDQQEGRRRHLGNAIAELEHLMQGFHFTLGRRTWYELSNQDGWVGTIRDLVDQKDAAGAAVWIGRLDAEKLDHESILLDIEQRVYKADPTGVGGKHIDGPRRIRTLACLQQVIGAARSWVEKTRQVAEGGAMHHMEIKAKILGSELREQISAIQADPGHGELDVARPLHDTMRQKLEILWMQS